MEEKEPAFYLVCPACGYKKTIYGPFPLSDFNKIIKKNEYCDRCGSKIKNITALDKK